MFWKRELGGIGEIRMRGPHEKPTTSPWGSGDLIRIFSGLEAKILVEMKMGMRRRKQCWCHMLGERQRFWRLQGRDGGESVAANGERALGSQCCLQPLVTDGPLDHTSFSSWIHASPEIICRTSSPGGFAH